MFVDADETDIAPVLTKLQSRWGRKVALGSYPDWLSNYHRVRLVLDSDSQEQMEKAQAQLLDELPAGSVVALVTDPVSIATTEVYTLADNGRGGGQRVTEDKLCQSDIRNQCVIAMCYETGCKEAANPDYFNISTVSMSPNSLSLIKPQFCWCQNLSCNRVELPLR